MAKYEQWLTEDGLLRISAWARNGLSNEQIAENIGISRKTFQEWLKRFPELKEAVRESKEVADIHVENALFKKCLGYTVEVTNHMKVRKVEYSDDGKKIAETEELVPVMDEVHIPADTNAQKFWLQHRKPEDWGKAVEELNSEEEGGVVEIPGIMPVDDCNNPSVSGADSSLYTREPLKIGDSDE